MVDVSFIIVSWNAKSFLLGCLKSIYETVDTRSFEIIVVDNDSSDGSDDAVEEFYPDVKLIRAGDNLGFAKANNIGIEQSCGRYVSLVNSDVEMLPDCVEKLVAYMDEEPSIGLLGPQVLYEDRTIQSSVTRFPTLWYEFCTAVALHKRFKSSPLFNRRSYEYWLGEDVRDVDVLAGCFWFARREALEEVGVLDEDFFFYGEDIDWCKRFHKADWRVTFFPPAKAIHYLARSSSGDPGRFWVQGQISKLVYWRKHYGSMGYLTFFMILVLRNSARAVGFRLLDLVRREKAVHEKWRWSLNCLAQLWKESLRGHS